METLRLSRERLARAGIPVVGERCLPLGSTAHAHVVDEIRATRAEVVVNSLIGPSSVAFLCDLARRDPARIGRTGHVVSCNQTEVDLAALGRDGDGLLAAGAFFEADAPPRLLAGIARHAPGERPSSFLATAYAAVEVVATAAARRRHRRPARGVRRGLRRPGPHRHRRAPDRPGDAPRRAPPRLATARGGRFHVVEQAEAPVPAASHLTAFGTAEPARTLRVVR